MTADELAQVPAILAKIMARRVQFFGALPSSGSLEQIGSADCSQIEKLQGGDGLASVNFSKLLGQMGKSMSVTSMQGGEGKYQRAIFGQDQWTSGSGSFEGLR